MCIHFRRCIFVIPVFSCTLSPIYCSSARSSTLYIKYALDLAEFLNERCQFFLASDLKADGNCGFLLLVGTAVDRSHINLTFCEHFRKKYNIPIYASEKEETTLLNPRVNLSAFGRGNCTLDADVYLKDLEVVEMAGFSVQMIETPGHTVGSCCYYLKDEGVLFSGDTVFQGSVGRTDFPEGSTAAIVRSLHRLLDALPDETEVYPGHDASTTIGYEKRYNPFV